jgi:hypothetical protein
MYRRSGKVRNDMLKLEKLQTFQGQSLTMLKSPCKLLGQLVILP